MKPKFITFTGADDKTDLAEMRALAKDFPVEFGILYSTSKRGEGRYPSNPFKFSGENLRLSLHICGQAARGIAEEVEALAFEGEQWDRHHFGAFPGVGTVGDDGGKPKVPARRTLVCAFLARRLRDSME